MRFGLVPALPANYNHLESGKTACLSYINYHLFTFLGRYHLKLQYTRAFQLDLVRLKRWFDKKNKFIVLEKTYTESCILCCSELGELNIEHNAFKDTTLLSGYFLHHYCIMHMIQDSSAYSLSFQLLFKSWRLQVLLQCSESELDFKNWSVPKSPYSSARVLKTRRGWKKTLPDGTTPLDKI